MSKRMQHTIYVSFVLGEIVFLRMAEDRCPGMVTGFEVNQLGVMYKVAWDDCRETSHYEIELSSEYSPVAG